MRVIGLFRWKIQYSTEAYIFHRYNFVLRVRFSLLRKYIGKCNYSKKNMKDENVLYRPRQHETRCWIGYIHYPYQ